MTTLLLADLRLQSLKRWCVSPGLSSLSGREGKLWLQREVSFKLLRLTHRFKCSLPTEWQWMRYLTRVLIKLFNKTLGVRVLISYFRHSQKYLERGSE